MTQIRPFAILAALLGVCLAAAPEARAGAAPEKAALCSACHGEKGVPIAPNIPALWGQNEGYIYLQLRDFKLGNRKNPMMSPVAEQLEKQDMKDLAAWFAAQPWPSLNQKAPPPEVAKQAETAINAAVCQSCHLANWEGASTAPRVGGQQAEYLKSTMTAFRDGQRTNNPWMAALLKTYSDSDIDAMARYLAAK